MLKKLIDELLTDVPVPTAGENLEEANDNGVNEVRALVNSEISEEIPEMKCSNDTLRKRMKRGWKMYRIFNTIGKEKMAQITSIPLSFILNLTQDDIDYMIAKVLKPSWSKDLSHQFDLLDWAQIQLNLNQILDLVYNLNS
ncbi:unnamed protein product [Rhizophagus irregularis]|nr:unnamed protein product [Rhizophagus irregularis]CAB5393490.1 unnamed protein product [Rhizophagus irregularis]